MRIVSNRNATLPTSVRVFITANANRSIKDRSVEWTRAGENFYSEDGKRVLFFPFLFFTRLLSPFEERILTFESF